LFLQGNPHHRVIVACIIVIQSGERVIVLAGEAFGGAQRPLLVALPAIGTIHLVAFDGCAACRIALVGYDTAQQIGLVERGASPIRFAQQMPGQRVVVGVALVAACAGVAVLLAPEGIDRQAGGAADGRAPKHAVARGIVDVPFLVGCTCVPLCEAVEVVVGERGRRAAVRAAGHIAESRRSCQNRIYPKADVHQVLLRLYQLSYLQVSSAGISFSRA
jgi:hypothetical protein